MCFTNTFFTRGEKNSRFVLKSVDLVSFKDFITIFKPELTNDKNYNAYKCLINN